MFPLAGVSTQIMHWKCWTHSYLQGKNNSPGVGEQNSSLNTAFLLLGCQLWALVELCNSKMRGFNVMSVGFGPVECHNAGYKLLLRLMPQHYGATSSDLEMKTHKGECDSHSWDQNPCLLIPSPQHCLQKVSVWVKLGESRKGQCPTFFMWTNALHP